MRFILCLIFGHNWKDDSHVPRQGRPGEIYYWHGMKCTKCGKYANCR